MSDKAIINTSTLTAIGEAIRSKENSTELIPTAEMADRIANIKTDSGLRLLMNNHVDEYGKWHKPDDWDDIESIDISGQNVCYLLCGTKLLDDAYVEVYSEWEGTCTASYGHVVDGVYTIYPGTSETTLTTSARKFGIDLVPLQATDDYIVIKIQSTGALKQVRPQGSSVLSGSKPYTAANTCCVLMRYARFTKANNITFTCYFLESDKLIDCGLDIRDTTNAITMSSMYYNNYNLQRVDWGNFDPARHKITSFASMFYNCYQLTDVVDPLDMTSWVTSNCTSVASMFQNCFCLRSELIVKNWDFTKVASLQSFLNNARSVPKLTGMNTWNAAPICTSIANFATNAYSLSGVLDFSTLALTSKLTGSMASAFAYTYKLEKIIFNNCNFANITSMGSVFQYSGIREIVWDTNFVAPGAKCTTFGTMFSSAHGIKEVIFDGWNFSYATGSRTLGNIISGSHNVDKIVFKNCTYPAAYKDDGTNASPLYQCTHARYMDFSEFDMSICTVKTNMHLYLVDSCTMLQEFYPPQHLSKSIKLSSSTMLSHDSLIRVINNLDTVTTATTLTLGTINLAKLTDDEKAVATGKGWTLA